MSDIEKILKIANNEVGYLEKASNNNLDDKTANAGSNNYTKYARDMDALNVYNGKKQGYAWCNIFIDWCFVQALGVERARELLIGFSAGCTQDYSWMKAKGLTVSNPQRGDLIFFGDLSHIGIVEKVENGKVYTIEGNTSNAAELIVNGGQVAKKSYVIGSKSIYGYTRPSYNQEAGNPGTEEKKVYSTIQRGSKGSIVSEAQQKLIAKGYKLPKFGADGHFGDETESVVKQLQKDAGIAVDGVIGNDTWNILNGDFKKLTKPTYPGYLIKRNQISEDARIVQQELITSGYSCGIKGADSIFGINTEDAVKAFQLENGLSVDGIVGPLTWNRLFN